MKKIMFVVNDGNFFVSHRLAIAERLLRDKYQVHLAVGENSTNNILSNAPFIIHPLNLKRNSLGLFSNILLFLQITILFLRIRPDLVHLITIKPVLLGGIASLFFRKMSVVVAITGLGYLYVSSGFSTRLIRYLAGICYKLVLSKKKLMVIFQNEDDRKFITSLTGLSHDKIIMIKGSGVDLKRHYFSILPEGIPVIIFASRLLIDKGIREFVEAARHFHKKKSEARFVLVGTTDVGNLASISETQLAQWVNEGIIEWWGFREDMPEVLSASHIVVLPSYREGFPKILIEASACGRPIITTDVPGCREAIIPNETGVLIRPKDPHALIEKLNYLLANRSLCSEMGRKGRALAENHYSLEKVVKTHIKVYTDLLDTK